MSEHDSNRIYTIGHSNHAVDVFLALLKQHAIEVLADVRSSPYSRYATHFNKDVLRTTLVENAVKYVFLGDMLGGRPQHSEFYDGDKVLYKKVAEWSVFQAGIFRVEEGMRRYAIALMCGEEDPTHCHRRLLVARALAERGVDIRHIRGDGRLQTEEEVAQEETGGQGELFGLE